MTRVDGRRLAGAAALIAVLTVASRAVGFGRWVVFGWTVRDTSLGEVYAAANLVPNIIFEIVAGGAMAGLVVPLLAPAVERGDRRAVSVTASALLTWTVVALVPLAVLLAVFARPVVGLLGADATAAELETGVRMLRVFAPQLPLYGVGIVLTGVLQAHRRFAWPVLAPLLSSLTVIGAYLLFAGVAGRGADLPEVGLTGQLILAVGTTAGVVVLTMAVVVPAARLGLRWRPGWGLPADARRRVRGLAAAGAAAVAGQQVVLVVLLVWGWAGPEGTLVHAQLAQAVYLLPWAVFAVPLATAAYPALSAAGAERDEDRYAATLAPAARGVLLLSFLGSAGLIVVAGPVAEVLLDGAGTGPLAAATVGFAPGLLGYAAFALFSRALYARDAGAAAGVVTIVGWLVSALAMIAAAEALPDRHRALALAAGNSVGMLVLGAGLVVLVVRRAGRDSVAGLARTAGVGALAAGLAVAAGLGIDRLLSPPLSATPADAGAVVQGMLSGGAAVAVFLAVAYRLDSGDLRPLLTGVRRRLRPARPRRPADGEEDRSSGDQ